jgi:hypothetical protein
MAATEAGVSGAISPAAAGPATEEARTALAVSNWLAP